MVEIKISSIVIIDSGNSRYSKEKHFSKIILSKFVIPCGIIISFKFIISMVLNFYNSSS